jgi:hypothetical protein
MPPTRSHDADVAARSQTAPSGEGALEGGTAGRLAMGGEHHLDRQVEQ